MGENAPEEQVLVDYPDSKSPSLYLKNPTQEEKVATWSINAANWGKALSEPDYLEREAYLTTVPLAKDNGVTHWILVDRNLPPNERSILASCESLRKPVLVSHNGVVTEGITHGIGSVFSQPKFRGKGYATRMLRELAPILKTWQTDPNIPGRETCPFSILYSDIGTKYYSKFGWEVHPSTHVALPPSSSPSSSSAKTLSYTDLPPLCALDEQTLRTQLSQTSDNKTHVALLPSYEQMQWHHKREDFVTSKIFSKSPTIKGAICDSPGSRVWAIWTRAYYGPLKPESGNTLHILRLVLEDERDTQENVESLKAVLQIAQREAEEWKVSEVDVWNPSQVVRSLVRKTGLEHEEVERKEESIASLMWYGEGKGTADEIRWVANEKFGWC
ncbi:uncharacterized protein LY89DRAFT_692196 [Mollisia scopiformis]|uniref:LYC1 C-terminal domain-containing protein n=1 Tax=Mollisia scopiformis TaxID=149040 RepID=A0A132B3L5_MOLSC|nr:uncharacterized protein LY89DRAFT_692196 [Mollisia scopiformis]KUJ06843.1 hypothetical protein LY89DRAFT_692196 [Mollisia scopiformis]